MVVAEAAISHLNPSEASPSERDAWDAVVINGVRYGGGGGSQTHTLVLKPCEYILRSQALTAPGRFYIKITTNFDEAEAGGNGGTASTYRGKITHIGGRRGGLPDR